MARTVEVSSDLLLVFAKSIREQLRVLDALIEGFEARNDWLTLDEVRGELPGISAKRLNTLSRAGVIETRKLSPRRTLYRRESIEYLKTGQRRKEEGIR